MGLFSGGGLGSIGSIVGGLLGGAVAGEVGTAIGSGLGAFAGSQDPGEAIGASLGSIIGVKLLGDTLGEESFADFVGLEGNSLGELGGMTTGSVLGSGIGALLGSALFSGIGDVEDERRGDENVETAEQRIAAPIDSTISPLADPRQLADVSGVDFLNYGSGAENVFFERVQ